MNDLPITPRAMAALDIGWAPPPPPLSLPPFSAMPLAGIADDVLSGFVCRTVDGRIEGAIVGVPVGITALTSVVEDSTDVATTG